MFDTIELKDLKEAVEGVNTGFETYKAANDLRLKEIEEKGSADPVTEEKLTKINDDLDKHQKTLDDFTLALKRKNTSSDGVSSDELDQKALDWATLQAKRNGATIAEFTNEHMDAYKAAYNKFLRKGDELIDIDSKKALSVGSDPDGGFVVHPDMSGQVVKEVHETSAMRQYASVQVISTDALEGLHDLERAGAEWVGETQARSTTDTPQFKAWRIPVHELSAKPNATQKLLDDAAINIESWLAEKVALEFSLSENTAFVSGDGVDRPRGFLTYTDGTTNPGEIEQFDTGVNGDFAADPNGGDVLLDAIYGLKAMYRLSGIWFLNRTTTREVRKLKDSDGAYLWQPGLQAGQPASLLAYPVASFEDMPAMATGSLSMAFGDMRAAYQIVDRMGIRVLRDPYSNKPRVEFYSTKRVGGDVVNFEAIKLINFQA